MISKYQEFINLFLLEEATEKEKLAYIKWTEKQEDPESAKNLMDRFLKVKHKLPNKDILSPYYRSDIEILTRDIESAELSKTKQELKKELKQDKDDVDTPRYKIIYPLSHEAMCFYGSSTKWCTASRDYDVSWLLLWMLGAEFLLIDKELNEADPGYKLSVHINNNKDYITVYDSKNVKIAELFNITELYDVVGKTETELMLNIMSKHITDVKQRTKEALTKIADSNSLEVYMDLFTIFHYFTNYEDYEFNYLEVGLISAPDGETPEIILEFRNFAILKFREYLKTITNFYFQDKKHEGFEIFEFLFDDFVEKCYRKPEMQQYILRLPYLYDKEYYQEVVDEGVFDSDDEYMNALEEGFYDSNFEATYDNFLSYDNIKDMIDTTCDSRMEIRIQLFEKFMEEYLNK